MLLRVLVLTCALALSVSGFQVTRQKMIGAYEQTGAKNLAMAEVKYYPKLNAYVLKTVAVEGKQFWGLPTTIEGTMPFVEPQQGAVVNAAAPGEYYRLDVSPNGRRYTGSGAGETIVGGVTVENSKREKVAVMAQFDSELEPERLARVVSAVDNIISNLENE